MSNANEFVQPCERTSHGLHKFNRRDLLAAVLIFAAGAAGAFDDANYPDWKGQWHRLPVPGSPARRPSTRPKRLGRAQQAPLTPEYQRVSKTILAEQAAGGHGLGRSHICIPPRHADGHECLRADGNHRHRGHHPHHDPEHGRAPPPSSPTAATGLPRSRRLISGYSIGKWIDIDGDGKLDTLEVETRHLKGPRVFDPTGLPPAR